MYVSTYVCIQFLNHYLWMSDVKEFVISRCVRDCVPVHPSSSFIRPSHIICNYYGLIFIPERFLKTSLDPSQKVLVEDDLIPKSSICVLYAACVPCVLNDIDVYFQVWWYFAFQLLQKYIFLTCFLVFVFYERLCGKCFYEMHHAMERWMYLLIQVIKFWVGKLLTCEIQHLDRQKICKINWNLVLMGTRSIQPRWNHDIHCHITDLLVWFSAVEALIIYIINMNYLLWQFYLFTLLNLSLYDWKIKFIWMKSYKCTKSTQSKHKIVKHLFLYRMFLFYYLSAHLYVWLSVYLPVSLSVCFLHQCLSVCLCAQPAADVHELINNRDARAHVNEFSSGNRCWVS